MKRKPQPAPKPEARPSAARHRNLPPAAPPRLETRTPDGLRVYSNPYDIRRDIHAFVEYIRGREIKRAHRSNQIPKTEARRLAKVMSHPDCAADVEKEGYSDWLDAIDSLCLQLGFTSYDTKGQYAGYSSVEPSFPDNYITFRADVYQAFLDLPLLEQEKRLFAVLCNDKKYREFYDRQLQSELGTFPIWGSATGVMPLLDFVQIRHFLFGLLAHLAVGQWYTTASLIGYLQQQYPYFLIPPAADLPKTNQWNRPQTLARYGNFYETSSSQDYYGHNREPIPDDAPDGFQRVEGRYVERFLEGIPLTLGYIDVAYDPNPYKGDFPEMGTLAAFRLNGRFRQFITNTPITPTVTVLPTFEIHVEAPFYPASVLEQLRPFTQRLTTDNVSILKLDKTLVKSVLAANEQLNILALLTELVQAPLPRNVAIELEEWSGQANTFTLYSDLALLEGNARLPELDDLIVAHISPTLRLIRRPSKVFDMLSQAEQVPIAIHHGENALTLLPPAAQTRFPQQKEVKERLKPPPKPTLTLQRETIIQLTAPSAETFEQLRAALVAQRCLFTADPTRLAITYGRPYQPQVDAALDALRQQYTLKIAAADKNS
ncbi:MAG: hypothetical protein IPM39_02440 [Chloroflexi bacterium]|nr:hypothetical protein [Chloroflexota bacterium]